MPEKPSEREEEYFVRQEYERRRKQVDKCSECEGVWLDAGELDAVAKMEKSGLDKLFGVFKR